MLKLMMLVGVSALTLGCSEAQPDSQTSASDRTEFSDETDRITKRLEDGGTVSSSDYRSDSSSDLDMNSDQEGKYDGLSEEGQDYVDQRMKEYDNACSTSAEC